MQPTPKSSVCLLAYHYQHLAWSVDRHFSILPVAVYRASVIRRTKVGYVKKPQVCCYKVRHLATKQLNGYVHMLRWCTALLNLKLVLCFEIIKNMK